MAKPKNTPTNFDSFIGISRDLTDVWHCILILVKIGQNDGYFKGKKRKPIILNGRGGAQRFEPSRLSHCLDNRITEGGEFVSLTRRPLFNPKSIGPACKKKTPWPESASELYRPSDRRLSAKLMPIDPYGCILGFPDRNRYFFFQVATQLYSGGWVDPVPDSLLLRKSSSAGNRTRTSGSVARNSDH
jgi:hypothetical protein